MGQVMDFPAGFPFFLAGFPPQLLSEPFSAIALAVQADSCLPLPSIFSGCAENLLNFEAKWGVWSGSQHPVVCH